MKPLSKKQWQEIKNMETHNTINQAKSIGESLDCPVCGDEFKKKHHNQSCCRMWCDDQYLEKTLSKEFKDYVDEKPNTVKMVSVFDVPYDFKIKVTEMGYTYKKEDDRLHPLYELDYGKGYYICVDDEYIDNQIVRDNTNNMLLEAYISRKKDKIDKLNEQCDKAFALMKAVPENIENTFAYVKVGEVFYFKDQRFIKIDEDSDGYNACYDPTGIRECFGEYTKVEHILDKESQLILSSMMETYNAKSINNHIVDMVEMLPSFKCGWDDAKQLQETSYEHIRDLFLCSGDYPKWGKDYEDYEFGQKFYTDGYYCYKLRNNLEIDKSYNPYSGELK